MASGPITSWQKNGKIMEIVRDYFLGLKITADVDCSHQIKMLAPWMKSYNLPRQCIIKHRYYFANKGLSSQTYGFSSSHVRMWELDHKEGWVPKNWYFWTVMLEKTVENPLNSEEIEPVNPKRHQPWIFIRRTDTEAEAPIFWPPDAKSQLIGKDPDSGKDWGHENGTTEDVMIGWCHWLNGNSRRWRTGKPGMLQPMRSPRVRHDLTTDQQQQKRNKLWLTVKLHHGC